MEWWSVFRTARRAVFGAMSFVSLLWAILLSVYIAKEWKHAVHAQRVTVLLMIIANTIFSVLLYLMVVVVFQLWFDLARTVSLFYTHLGFAVALTVLGRTFDCSAFNSQKTCTGTLHFAQFMEWTMAIIFLLHAVSLCVMSRIPQSELKSPSLREKQTAGPDLEGQFHEVDLKSPAIPLSPDIQVHQVERVSVAPAMLMTLGSTPSRTPTMRSGPWKYTRNAAPESLSRSSTMDAMPALPYGASSIAGFVDTNAGRSSPAPSYSSQDPAALRVIQFPTRRMRSLRLNRYVVDPLARNGSVDSVASSDSSNSMYDSVSGANVGQFPRPPRAVVLKRSSSDASVSPPGLAGPKTPLPYDLPPQLRPGTPTSATTFNFPRTPTMYVGDRSINAHVPSRVDTATPNSLHPIESSLCFTDVKGSTGPVVPPTTAENTNTSTSANLTRQPTQTLRLPNPFGADKHVPPGYI